MHSARKMVAVKPGKVSHRAWGRAETARDREIQAAVKAGSLAFWDAMLKDDAAARQWLNDGGFKSMLDEKDRFASK